MRIFMSRDCGFFFANLYINVQKFRPFRIVEEKEGRNFCRAPHVRGYVVPFYGAKWSFTPTFMTSLGALFPILVQSRVSQELLPFWIV